MAVAEYCDRQNCRKGNSQMKRFLSLAMGIMMLLSWVSFANAETAEETAKDIFNELSNIYDASMYYLEQRQSTWSALLSTGYKPDDMSWFYENIVQYTNTDRYARIIAMGMNYGYSVDEVRDIKGIYDNLFMPIYKRAGQTDEGFKKACFAFALMAFWDSSIPDRLEQQKNAIQDLMKESPEYANLDGLKEFFKKTSTLVDFTQAGDTYVNTAQRISDFKITKSEIKNDFVFDFDWPDFSPEFTEDATFTALYEQQRNEARAAKDAEIARKTELANAMVYDEALSHEENGDYVGAIRLYNTILEYKDSKERVAICEELENKKMQMANELHVTSKHIRSYLSTEVVDVHDIPDDWPVNQPDYTVKYMYNEAGYLVQISEECENGSYYPSTEKFDIDGDGHIISGTKSGVWFADDGCTYDSVTAYDEHNNIIREERTYHSPKNEQYTDGETHVYSHEYTYDERGNILTDDYYVDGEKSKYQNHSYIYTYDDNGKVVSFEDRLKITYLEYDEAGLLVRELKENKEKEAGKSMVYTIIEYTYQSVKDL